jgi:hypothetical protein
MRSYQAFTFRMITFLSCLSLTALLLSACGSSTTSNTPVVLTTPQSTYLVEYVPGAAAAKEGKTTFQLKVKHRSDGSPAAGLTLKLAPIMHMSDKDHGTPVDVVTETVPGTSGTYDCTVYYLMGDHMMSTLMGYWELQVKIGAEVASFYPSVSSQMAGADTWKATMKSSSDILNGKTYYLFSDGMVTAASPTFKLYISRSENDPPTIFSAISAISSPAGTVASVVVTASTDSTFPVSPGATVDATDDGNGHFSFTGLTDLVSAATHTVYVKLNVDAEDKTSDGLATNASGTNLYQSFKVTSH